MNQPPSFGDRFLAMLQSWFPADERDESRIPDEYYKRLIRMYKSRATFWRSVGILCLALTASIIFVGIVIFWTGDPADEKRAESEIALSVELAGHRRKLSEIGASGAKTLAQAGIATRAFVLANILGRAKPTLDSFVRKPEPATRDRAKLIVDTCRRILEPAQWSAIDQVPSAEGKSKATDEVVIKVAPVIPNDSNRFPRQTLDHLQVELRATGESKAALLELLGNLSKLLDDLPVDPVGSSQLKELQKLAESAMLSSLDQVNRQIETQNREAELALEKWQREAPFREEERQAIEANIASVEEQLKEVRAERDKILFMSWVPDLTLRVGAVVLLLFLTQILLGAYRYTISLSTFYLARADAIQLLQPQAGQETWYNTEHLKTLLEKLSPDAISIESVKSPNDHIADLATAWIGKK